ncbi:MAG: septum formation initiator family protein [Emcibacteraceae bacterium]|nr:septum formation initiator family protein [Emcibacteraceae bacterium]
MTVPFIALLVSCYFGAHGFKSVTAQNRLGEEIFVLESEQLRIETIREDLELHVGLLSSNHIDPDYLDELVRKDLGFTHPDEIIIPNSQKNK